MDKDEPYTISITDIDLTLSEDTVCINSSASNYVFSNNYNMGAIGSSGSYLTSGANGTNWASIGIGASSNSGSLQVTGDAEFEGDVKIKGVSIANTLEKINQRLNILVPDPEKLEHFAALKKAYEHYKTLEALCEVPTKEDKE